MSLHTTRHLPAALIVAALLHSCAGGDDKQPVSQIDPDEVPMMVTHQVRTLISDSGITKYRVTTPVWYVYDGGERPRWHFPEGILLEEFDHRFKVIASIRSDTAHYDTKEQLWRLNDNVRVQNAQGDLILTEELYWDQRAQEVRTDSFVHIERPDRTIEGYGFTSNQSLTKYQIHRVQAILPMDDNKMRTQ